MTMKSLIWILLPLLCLPSIVHAQKKGPPDLLTKDARKAIDSGLAVLATQQHQDGSFGTGQFKGNVGVTALAGLAFLSKGPHENYDNIVTKAIQHVLNSEDPNRPGYLHQAVGHGPMYSQGFAILFLADAMDTIKDESLQTKVKSALDRSVKLVIDTQNNEGGWRYLPVKGDADISVTTCQIVALRAARDVGIGVPRKTLARAAEYVAKCQDERGGGFRYQPAGGSGGFARSAAALVALDRVGYKNEEALKKGLDFVRRFKAKEEGPAGSMHFSYGHYYAAKAMWYAGDKEWQEWYPHIRDELVKSQQDDCRWTRPLTCPHYDTGISLIVLQMPNQHLTSLKR